jgi:biotin carboxyl carrier protein
MIVDATLGARIRRIEIKGSGESPEVTVDGKTVDASAVWISAHSVHLILDGRSHDLGVVKEAAGTRVSAARRSYLVDVQPASSAQEPVARRPSSGPAAVRAPMPGKIVRVLASDGQEVVEGTGLLVMEAMKMENEIRSPRAGIVRGVSVREGQAVETGATLCVLE